MRVLATYNLKGGVGKTASAVNLAWLSARSGVRTLVWDLDPQGAATFYFRVKPKVKGGGKALITGRRPLDDVIRGSDFDRLDLIPADLSYRHLDLLLDAEKKSRKRLRHLLEPMGSQYDVVILDCPPAISLLTEAVLEATDALLVPTMPTTLAVRTLAQTRDFVADHAPAALRMLPFFTMVDARKRLHKRVLEELPATFPELLSAAIPNASAVEQMGVHRAPVGAFAPDCPAAHAYASLWDEIVARLADDRRREGARR